VYKSVPLALPNRKIHNSAIISGFNSSPNQKDLFIDSFRVLIHSHQYCRCRPM